MKTKFIILIFILALANLSAQYEIDYTIGGGFGYSLLHNQSSFSKIGDIPNCCPEYTGGMGNSLSFHGYFQNGLNDKFDIAFYLSGSQVSSDMTSNEVKPVYNGVDAYEDAVIEHSLNIDYTRINLRPTLVYEWDYGFDFIGGLNLDYRFGGNIDQVERIESPGYIRYDDDTRSRLAFNEDLEQLNALGVGLNLGVRYNLPMDYSGRLILVPELTYDYYLTNVVGDLSGGSEFWRYGGLNFAATVQYNIFVPQEKPQPILPKGTIDDKSIAVNIPAPNYNLAGDLEVELINPNETIVVQNLISTTYAALLNYIFFDHNESELPERYFQITPSATKKFFVNDLKALDNLDIYHNLLNVMGRRMVNHPETELTVLGCNSGVDEENNNLELSQKRAETIKNYLVDIWSIDPNRITIKKRNLPETTTTDNEAGAEENRRVELLSDDYELMKPIKFTTRHKIIPEDVQLIFYPEVDAEAGLKDWNINITQNGKLLKSFTGYEQPEDKVVWNIKMDQQDAIPDTDGPLDINYTVRDNEWQEFAMSTKKDVFNKPKFRNFDKIDVNQVEIKKTKIEKFNLILFGFNESEIKDHNLRIVELIKSKMTENSTITIEGFTDKTGDPDYNIRLSKRRALELAKKMEVDLDLANGRGSSILLYRNDLPEGRYYCRTVEVTIETPIIEGEED